jgi:hypothetical protein
VIDIEKGRAVATILASGRGSTWVSSNKSESPINPRRHCQWPKPNSHLGLKPEQLLRVGPEHVASDGIESSARRACGRARPTYQRPNGRGRSAEEPRAKSSASPRKHPTFGGETVRGATTTTDRCTAATTRIRPSGHILTWNGRKRCRAAREHGHGQRPQSSVPLGARATASMPLKHARQPHASVLDSVRPRPVSISTHGPSGNRINLGRKKRPISVLLVRPIYPKRHR